MNLKSQKVFKLVFLALICAVAAYMIYVMISYYATDKDAAVSLSFNADSSNIMTGVTATYTMKENEGYLTLETNEKTEAMTPDGMVGKVFEIKNTDKAVSDACLTVTYSDEYVQFDENDIKLMRIDKNGNSVSYKCTVDQKQNTVTANFFGGGVWYLGK